MSVGPRTQEGSAWVLKCLSRAPSSDSRPGEFSYVNSSQEWPHMNRSRLRNVVQEKIWRADRIFGRRQQLSLVLITLVADEVDAASRTA